MQEELKKCIKWEKGYDNWKGTLTIGDTRYTVNGKPDQTVAASKREICAILLDIAEKHCAERGLNLKEELNKLTSKQFQKSQKTY